MNIRINNGSIDAVSVSVEKNVLTIQIIDTDNPLTIIQLIHDSDSIEYIDESGNIIQKFEGKFNSVITEQTKGFMYIHIQLPPVTENEVDDVTAIKEAITNIELALCEIYESMEV